MHGQYTALTSRRRNYWCTDLLVGQRTVGRLVSTPAGYMLQTQDAGLRWFRRRYYRTPGHLLDAVRLQRLRT